MRQSLIERVTSAHTCAYIHPPTGGLKLTLSGPLVNVLVIPESRGAPSTALELGFMRAIFVFSVLLVVGLAPSPSLAQPADASIEPAPAQVPELPPSQGKHCMKEQKSKWVMHQHLVGQYNPGGAEHHLRAGLCIPLITTPGLLYDLTNIEVGVLSYLTPAYLQLGGYFQITPLSLLILRFEGSGLGYWNIGLQRTGYYPVRDYKADYRESTLKAEDGAAALGWNINMIAVLRAKVPLGPVSLLALSQFAAEYWDVGDAGFHFNLRRDAITAKGEWVMTNEALIGIEIPLPDNTLLRLGVYDTYRYVVGSEYEGNIVGGFAMAAWDRLGEQVHDFAVFTRIGGHVEHAYRVEEAPFTFQIGFLMGVDLGEF